MLSSPVAPPPNARPWPVRSASWTSGRCIRELPAEAAASPPSASTWPVESRKVTRAGRSPARWRARLEAASGVGLEAYRSRARRVSRTSRRASRSIKCLPIDRYRNTPEARLAKPATMRKERVRRCRILSGRSRSVGGLHAVGPESVPHAADGLDPVPDPTELRAQPLDVRVHRPAFHVLGIAPHLAEELVAAVGPAGAPRHAMQELVLGGGEV